MADIPVEIAYRNIERSSIVERHVLRGLARLEEIAPRIVRCRVAIGRRNQRSRTGDLYDVRVDLSVPRRERVVTGTAPTQKAGKTLPEAMDEAFEKARRRLIESSPRERRAHVSARA